MKPLWGGAAGVGRQKSWRDILVKEKEVGGRPCELWEDLSGLASSADWWCRQGQAGTIVHTPGCSVETQPALTDEAGVCCPG